MNISTSSKQARERFLFSIWIVTECVFMVFLQPVGRARGNLEQALVQRTEVLLEQGKKGREELRASGGAG
jgi:hypothetical protein